MIGFLIGAVGLIGILKVAKKSRCANACADSGGHPFRSCRARHFRRCGRGFGHGSHGDADHEMGGDCGGGKCCCKKEESSPGWFRGGYGLFFLKRRWRLTDEQENQLKAAFAELREGRKELKKKMRKLRSDMAVWVSSEVWDEQSLETALAEIEGDLQAMKTKAISMLKDFHASLTPQQRSEIASFFEKGRF